MFPPTGREDIGCNQKLQKYNSWNSSFWITTLALQCPTEGRELPTTINHQARNQSRVGAPVINGLWTGSWSLVSGWTLVSPSGRQAVLHQPFYWSASEGLPGVNHNPWSGDQRFLFVGSLALQRVVGRQAAVGWSVVTDRPIARGRPTASTWRSRKKCISEAPTEPKATNKSSMKR
jgi:hypothetical protein